MERYLYLTLTNNTEVQINELEGGDQILLLRDPTGADHLSIRASHVVMQRFLLEAARAEVRAKRAKGLTPLTASSG